MKPAQKIKVAVNGLTDQLRHYNFFDSVGYDLESKRLIVWLRGNQISYRILWVETEFPTFDGFDVVAKDVSQKLF